jgi:hypothetical protein
VDKRHKSGRSETPLTTLLAVFDTGVDKVPSVAEVHAILDGDVVLVRIVTGK